MIDETTVAASVAMLVHRELADDGVGLWALPWHIRRALPEAGDRQPHGSPARLDPLRRH
jgi:hypothetical protein